VSEEERSRERAETKVKKRALELSGKAAVEEGGRGVGRRQTKENHAWFVIRGIPLAILEPLSPALSPRLLLLLSYSLRPSLPFPLAQRPHAFLLVYGIFFTRTPSRTSEKVVNLLFSLFLRNAPDSRVSSRKQEKERKKERERERERRERASGEREGNNKKEQMPAAIKTTESIKNFRPFTTELPRRNTVGYVREKSTTSTMHQDVSRR